MERNRRRTVSVAPSHTAAGLPTVTRRALPMLAPEHTVRAAPHVYLQAGRGAGPQPWEGHWRAGGWLRSG